MKKDPIIEELHKQRAAHAKKFNYDVGAMFDDLIRRQQCSGSIYVTREHPGKPNPGKFIAVDGFGRKLPAAEQARIRKLNPSAKKSKRRAS